MHDAEVADPDDPRRGWRRVSPQHPPLAWVRVDGSWRKGWVHAWFQRPDGSWLAWLFYDVGKIASEPEMFVYEEETIRPRDGDQPPTS